MAVRLQIALHLLGRLFLLAGLVQDRLLLGTLLIDGLLRFRRFRLERIHFFFLRFQLGAFRFDLRLPLPDFQNQIEIGTNDAFQKFQTIRKIAERLGAHDDLQIIQLPVHIDGPHAPRQNRLPPVQGRDSFFEFRLILCNLIRQDGLLIADSG